MTKQRIYMACDTQVTCYNQAYYVDTKMYRKGQTLIGQCGTAAIDAALDKMDWHDDWSPSDMSLALRAAITPLQPRNTEEDHEFALLVASPHGLFLADDDFSVVPVHRGFATTGSGGGVALGSLLRTGALGRPPRERVVTAVQDAICVDVDCGGRVKVEYVVRK